MTLRLVQRLALVGGALLGLVLLTVALGRPGVPTSLHALVDAVTALCFVALVAELLRTRRLP